MSAAQLLEEVKSFSGEEIESLEGVIRLEKLRRAGIIASPEETQLLGLINKPLSHSIRYYQLRGKLSEETLTEEAHAELIRLSDEREIEWAQKLEAVSRLAALRGEDFQTLYDKLGIQNTTGFKE